MSNRIKITEAISLCNASTGRPIKEIEEVVRSYLWPYASEKNRKQNLRNLKAARITKLSFDQVQIICQITGCDANFLFEIN